MLRKRLLVCNIWYVSGSIRSGCIGLTRSNPDLQFWTAGNNELIALTNGPSQGQAELSMRSIMRAGSVGHLDPVSRRVSILSSWRGR